MQKSLNQIKLLISSRTVKNTITVFTGNFVSSVIGIIFTIVVARALGPESWGFVAAVASIVGIMVAIGEVGLDASLLKYVPYYTKKGKYKFVNNLISTIFSLRIFTSLFFGLLLLIFATPFAHYVFKKDLPILTVFTSLGFVGALLIDFQITLSQARKKWALSSLYLALTNILRISLVAVTLFYFKLSLFYALLIFSISPLLAFFFSFIFTRTTPSINKSSKEAFNLVRNFSGLMGSNKVISSISSRLDVLLLIQLTSAREVGIYAAANRLAMGVPLVVSSFATVLAPAFSEIQKGKKLNIFFKKSVYLSVILILGLLVGILITPLIIKLLGPDYQDSSLILQLLFIAYTPFILSIPAVNGLIYAFKKPQIIVVTSLIQLPLIFLLNLFLIPIYGSFAPVIVLFLVNSMTLIVAYIFIFKNLK